MGRKKKHEAYVKQEVGAIIDGLESFAFSS